MSKKFSFSVVVFLLVSFVYAQDHTFSFRGGLLHKTSSYENAASSTANGLYMGMQYQFLHFVTSVNYTISTAQGESVSSIYVPLCSKFALADKLYLIGGPVFDFSLNAADTENTHLGYTLGSSYELNNHLSLEAHYSYLFAKESQARQLLVGVLYQLN